MEKFVWVPLKKSGAQSSPTYGLAKVAQDISQNQVLVQFLDNKLSEQKVDKSDILPAASQIVENLSSMDEINEPSVLNNIVKRYLNDLPYTYCGPALLFVNSTSLESLLSEEALQSARIASTQETLERPHLFHFANKVYHEMIQSYQNQTIVLAGRSGSGKSFNLKQLLRFFGSLAVNERQNKLLQQAGSILEVFANARTSHSDSSSRHQQVVDVQFDACGRVHGANFWSFNIELDRLVAGESNFEIFYLIQQDPELRNKYQLHQKFILLSEAKEASATLSELTDSLKNVGFTVEELEDIWKILIALLHLGNLQFAESGVKDKEPLNAAATLLGVNSSALEKGLSSQQAARNTIKTLYERLFTWILKKINQALTPTTPVKYSISIVDITGFESYKKNGIYQLYVNYLNEKLRQLFVDNIFRDVQDYVQEDLDLSELEYLDSDHTVMNIIEKQNGILSLLEKASSTEGETDGSLAKQIVSSNVQSEVFKGMGGTSFSLAHYSSDTTYDTSGWIESNVVVLPYELEEVFSLAENSLLSAISSKQATATSVAQQFRSNARKLTTILESFVAPYFLITIKPNVSSSFEIDHTFVLDQLFEYGITETAQVYNQGYQVRLSLKDFLKRYYTPEQKEAPLSSQKERKAVIRTILQEAGVEESQYAIGNTKVFLKDAKALSKVIAHSERQDIPLIECTQARFRGIMSRRQTNKLMEQAISAALIQRNWRSYVQLKDWSWRQLYIAAMPQTSAMKQDIEGEKVREELAYYRRRKAEQMNERVTENNEKRELQIQLAELELENRLEKEVLNEAIRKYEREYKKYEDFADSSYKEHLMGEKEQKLLVLMEEIERKKRMLSELEEIQKQLSDIDSEERK